MDTDAHRCIVSEKSVDLEKRTRLIAGGGAAIGPICLGIGRSTRYGDIIISSVFLAFFAWIWIASWMREHRSIGRDDAP